MRAVAPGDEIRGAVARRQGTRRGAVPGGAAPGPDRHSQGRVPERPPARRLRKGWAAVKPLNILETCVYARDLEAAERFYTTVLGLEVIARMPGRHVFFRCGRGVFLVFNPDKTETESHLIE